MRLLIVSDAYPPEIRSSSHLMIELAQGLRDLGHAVTVLTGWPAFNLDSDARGHSFTEVADEDGVLVIRVKTLPHHNVGFLRRGIAQLLLPWQFLAGLHRNVKEVPHGVIVYSPPLPLGFVGEALRRRGARYVLNVQDLFPQNAIDLGVLTNPVLVAFFRWMEKHCYRHADLVTTHSEGNRAMLAADNPGMDDRLVVLHNWIDCEPFETRTPGDDFRERLGLKGKFVIVYGGVIGPAQGLDVVLDVATRVQDLRDLVFLIVGEGMEKKALVDRAVRERLDNVMFQAFVSRDRYPALLRAADAGLLTLSPRMRTPVVPGKLLGYMAAGIPVFAFVNGESDAHGIIADSGCGFSCAPYEQDKAEAALRRAYSDRAWLVECGRRGRDYAIANFGKAGLVKKIDTYLTGGR